MPTSSPFNHQSLVRVGIAIVSFTAAAHRTAVNCVSTGVYMRGAHTLATGQAQLEKLPAVVRSQKHVEVTLQELRVSPDLLPMPTRTVSAAWLSLRNEVIQYVDLERQLAIKQGGDGGALGRKRSKFVR